MKTGDRFRAALVAAGISTLDELVKKLDDDPRSPGESILMPAVAGPEPAPVAAKPGGHAHPRPKVPILLDGKRLKDADELASFGKTPLFYTPIRGRSGTALAAFTSREAMYAEAKGLAKMHIEGAVAPADDPICQEPPDNLPDGVDFYVDINQGGGSISLPGGRAYHDLTQVGRDKFLWWYTDNWNDTISSVSWCKWDVSLFWDINYGGAQLWLPAGCNTPNLVDLGWNDQASAIVNWGQRFPSQPVLA